MVPNLCYNVQLNAASIQRSGGAACAATLDWCGARPAARECARSDRSPPACDAVRREQGTDGDLPPQQPQDVVIGADIGAWCVNSNSVRVRAVWGRPFLKNILAQAHSGHWLNHGAPINVLNIHQAVGKLCVVPAGALPVRFGSAIKGLYRVQSPSFLQPKPDICRPKQFYCCPGRQHNCFPISSDVTHTLTSRIVGAAVHEQWMAAAVEAMLRRYLRQPGARAILVNPAANSRAGVEAFQRCVCERLEYTQHNATRATTYPGISTAFSILRDCGRRCRLLRERGYRWSVETLEDAELWSGHEQERGAVALELYQIERGEGRSEAGEEWTDRASAT